MPIRIPDSLPAHDVLTKENIFVMSEKRAITQDIRPLNILILNLMPLKIQTEIHLLRRLSNTPLQVHVDLIHPRTYTSQNTPQAHLDLFYRDFSSVKKTKYDGMIMTGAPVELLSYHEVKYWDEITEIIDWAQQNVTSSFYICWAALAGLYRLYGVPKYERKLKLSGVYPHTTNDSSIPLVRGFDDIFMAPHSRHSEVRSEDIARIPELTILSESSEAGVYIVIGRDGKDIFVTGHSEYDPLTLKEEFIRDTEKGLNPAIPKNYFPDDDPSQDPIVQWRSHAGLLFSNWLNYYVYQTTPYDPGKIG